MVVLLIMTGLTLSVSIFFMFHRLFLTAVENFNSKSPRKNRFFRAACESTSDPKFMCTQQSKATGDGNAVKSSVNFGNDDVSCTNVGSTQQSVCVREVRESRQDVTPPNQGLTTENKSTTDINLSAGSANLDVSNSDVDSGTSASVGLKRMAVPVVGTASSQSLHFAVMKNTTKNKTHRGEDSVHQSQSDIMPTRQELEELDEELDEEDASAEIIGDSDYIDPAKSAQSQHSHVSSYTQTDSNTMASVQPQLLPQKRFLYNFTNPRCPDFRIAMSEKYSLMQQQDNQSQCCNELSLRYHEESQVMSLLNLLDVTYSIVRRATGAMQSRVQGLTKS